ncbi:MAG: tail fiber domain-containing protein [Candidatus Azambacteria bacterium]|nr:tail fiber domain-containing protein [Candidatus Azambacteria bacterium]
MLNLPEEIKNTKQNSRYIPLAEAGEILGTSRDYLNVLVRRGKLRAVKLGRNWFTTDEWISEYKAPAGKLEQEEKAELASLRDASLAERLERVESRFENISTFRDKEISKKIYSVVSSQEIKLPSRKLEPEEKTKILESVKERIQTIDSNNFHNVSKKLGIRKSLESWSAKKLSIASALAGLVLIVSLGMAAGVFNFSPFGGSPVGGQFSRIAGQANIFSNFPNDVSQFTNWLANGINKSISIFNPSQTDLTIEELESGKSKIAVQEETLNSINSLAQAEALDSQAIEEYQNIASGETGTGGQTVSISGSNFSLLENRLSLIETNLRDQSELFNSELSVQKKTILGTLGALFGIAKMVPEHPGSTIVVQGQPATLTTYSVSPQVQSGFDRLSATYLSVANDATINGSLTVKSGGNFNSLGVSGNTSLNTLSVSGLSSLTTLNISGDSTLNNLTLSGTLDASASSVIFANASTTNLTVSGNTWITNGTITNGTITNGTITNASTTYATLPTFWGTNGTITNASTTYATLPNFWSTNGTITNASTTYLTVGSNFWGDAGLVSTAIQTPLIWNNGTLTASTTGANPIIFATNSLERMRIDANGYVAIATTTMPVGFGFNIATSTFTYGNQFISGGLGVGIATTTNGVLQTSGDASIGGNLYVSGNSTIASNLTVIGASSANTLTINSSINSNLVPDQNAARDLGSTSMYWKNAYISTLTVNSISAASTTIGGTQSDTFTINSDNATADNETETLIFFRGQIQPNALLTWNSATSSKRFEFNQSLYINNGSASTTNPTFTIQSIANQTANALQIIDNNSSAYFTVNPTGSKTTMVNASTTYATLTNFWGTTGNVANLTVTNASTTNLSISGNLWGAGSILLSDGLLGSPSLSFTNDTDSGLYRVSDNKMSFVTGSAVALTIDSQQYVGIGAVTSPQATIDIGTNDIYNNTIVDTAIIRHNTTGTAANGLGTALSFWGEAVEGTSQQLARIAGVVEQATTTSATFGSYLSFWTTGSGGIQEKMRLTSTGGLALATTTMPSGYGFNVATSTNIYGNLTVSGNGTITNASSTYSTVSDTAWINNLVATNATTTTFRASGLATFGGNVGIGTTSPGAPLVVANTSQASQAWIVNSTNGRGMSLNGDYPGFGVNSYYDGGAAWKAFNSEYTGIFQFNPLNGNWQFFTGNNPGANQNMTITLPVVIQQGGSVGIGGNINNDGTLTGAKLVVQSTGNVGIGTTSPNNLLTISGATTPSLGFTVANGLGWTMGIDTADSNKFKIASSTAVGTNTRLTIDNSGNVGIGTTNPAGLLTLRTATAQSLANSFSSLRLELQTASTSPGGTGPQLTFAQSYHSGAPAEMAVTGAIRGYKTGNDLGYGGGLQLLYQPDNVGFGMLPAVTLTGGGNVIVNGTSDTTSKFSVFGGANVHAGRFYGNSTASQSLGINIDAGTNSADYALYIRNQAASADYLYVRGDGNVGIGTTTPKAPLQIGGQLSFPTDGTDAVIADNLYYSSGWKHIANSLGSMVYQQDGSITLYTSATGAADSAATLVSVMSTTAAGNVGIGTTAPDGKLHVFSGSAGTVTADANADDLTVENSGAGGISILTPGASDGNLFFGNESENATARITREATTGDLKFSFQSGVGIFRFQQDGKLGIGTTAPTAGIELDVEGQAECDGAGCWTVESDMAYKKDIIDLNYGLSEVLQMTPRRYTLRETNENSFGLIAQELETIIPELVRGEEGHKNIGYDGLAPILVNAMKELASTTVSLQNQINALVASSTLTAANGTFALSTMNSDLNLNGFAILNVKSITGFNNLWSIDSEGNIIAKSVQTQALTVGGGAASGITVYDRQTSAPKCIYIEGGAIMASDGACGSTINAGVIAPISQTIPVATSSVSEINTATSTPEIIIPPAETATSTPEILPTETATSTEPIIIDTATTTPDIIIPPVETATTTP